MFGFHLPELLIVLFIVILLFGAKRLPAMSASIGKSITAFKKSVNESDEQENKSTVGAQQNLLEKSKEIDELERELAQKRAAYKQQQ